jgi:poly(3-hydroxybutyrate) depolymerase
MLSMNTNKPTGTAPRAPHTRSCRDAIVAPVNADKLIASHTAAGAETRADLHVPATIQGGDSPGRRHTRRVYRDTDRKVVAEQWTVHGGSHAWFGGSPVGSYTDPPGPDASAEMLRFFLENQAPVTSH